MTADLVPTMLGIVLVACAAAFALFPLARGVRAAPASPETPGETDRAPIYRHILELEFDHQLGKLSAEDYRQLSSELLAQAGQLMHAERGGLGELDDEIEREIAAARAAFSAARRGGGARRAARSSR